MKQMVKRIVCLMLVAIFCLTALIACKKNTPADTTPSDTTPTDTSDTTPTINDADTLGEYDFGGAEFKILARKSALRDFNEKDAEGITAITNEVFNSMETTKARFNVTFKVDPVEADWHNNLEDSELYQKYSGMSMVGMTDYSLVTGHFPMQNIMVINGFCCDMTKLKTVDMEKAWWSKPFYEACNINGRFYVALGDITHSMYDYLQVIYVNETMAQSYVKDADGNPIDLYALVESGGWTYEKLVEYTKKVGYNQDDPKYGLYTHGHATHAMMLSMGVTVSQKNEQGIWEFPATATEKQGRYDEVVAFIKGGTSNSVYWKYAETDHLQNGNKMFTEGDVLFYAQQLSAVTAIGEAMASGQTYGILPLPKYDTNQLEYYTTMRDTVTSVTVPRFVVDQEMAGVVTEALCMYGYQKVKNVYFDTVVKGRYLTDEKLRTMLDTIRSGLTASFDMAYSPTLEANGAKKPWQAIDHLASSSTTLSFSTYYDTYKSLWTTNANNIYKKLGVEQT